MASLPYELLFLTTSKAVVVKDRDQACFRLRDRATDVESHSGDECLHTARKLVHQAKNLPWRVHGRLKEQIREFERLQEKERCLTASWIAPGNLAMIFANGTFCLLALESSALQSIFIDRTLCEKITDQAVHAVLTSKMIAVAFYDPKILLVRFDRPLHQNVQRKSLFVDTRITTLDLVGTAGRRNDRRMSWSPDRSWLLVYWNVTNNEAVPWSPLITEKNRANVLVYTMLESSAIELFSYGRLEKTILAAELSEHNSNNLLTVEQENASRPQGAADHQIQVCIHQISQGRFVRLSCVSLTLDSPFVACAFHQPLQKLLISTRSQSLFCYDGVRRTLGSQKFPVCVDRIKWHPGGAFVVVASLQGKLMCLDLALNVIPMQALSDFPASHGVLDLNPFFRHKPSPAHIEWEPHTNGSQSVSAVVVDKTCLILLDLRFGSVSPKSQTPTLWGPTELCELYMRNGQYESSLEILHSLSWTEYPMLNYQMLLKCYNRLLREPYSDTIESLLERSMAPFFSECSSMEEDVLEQFLPRVTNLSRRFFFQLVRFGKFEKAFLLAVDLESVDLFHDLTSVAKMYRLPGLLQASARKIDELESSNCSSSTVSRSSASTDSDEETGSSSSNEEMNWSMADLFVRVEPSHVKVASATPTKQLRNPGSSLTRRDSGLSAANQSFESTASVMRMAGEVDEEQTQLAKGVECLYFG